MKIGATILLVAGFIGLSNRAEAQVKAFDQLERLYDQGHYGVVYRRANRLLDKPDYDYSLQPEFYKSLALFQLSQRDFFFRLHPDALQEARRLFLEVKASSDGMKVFNAHVDHVTELKRDLAAYSNELKRSGQQDKFDELQQILIGLFDHVPELDLPDATPRPDAPDNEVAETPETLKERQELVDYAKKQLGVPYKWSGDDSNGFDCSGFSSYVMKKHGKTLPRRAEDQYKESRKVKQRNAQKGDLIFFNNGSGISHVGMLISEKGKPLVMIHASSSKGIVITEIETSEYWLNRIYAFGTYID